MNNRKEKEINLLDYQVNNIDESIKDNYSSGVNKNTQNKYIRYDIKPTQMYYNERIYNERSGITVDLHGCNKEETYVVFKNSIRKARRKNISHVNFITGKGCHSIGHISVLRPYVLNLCKTKNIEAKILPENKGVIRCKIE